MRTLLVFALLAQVVTVVPDAIREDTARIEKDGERVGEIRRDVLNPNHYRVYDKNGGQVGTWKKDVLYPNRYRFEETR